MRIRTDLRNTVMTFHVDNPWLSDCRLPLRASRRDFLSTVSICIIGAFFPFRRGALIFSLLLRYQLCGWDGELVMLFLLFISVGSGFREYQRNDDRCFWVVYWLMFGVYEILFYFLIQMFDKRTENVSHLITTNRFPFHPSVSFPPLSLHLLLSPDQ